MAKNERGLGKGLGALLGDAALQTQESGSLSLPISQVQPGLNQPRKRFTDASLAELADSIHQHGIIQPLTVRRLASGYYQIIAGERRWRAAKLAGLTEVPAIIIEADDKKVMELGLIENLQREDLNPMEEAKGYKVLMEVHGLTQEEVARRMGKSRPTVANAVRLLSLPESVQQMLEEGDLSAGHARALLSLPSGEAQEKLAQKILVEGLSVRQTETLAKRVGTELSPSKKPKRPPDFYLVEAAQSLANRFGRKVTINGDKKKGKVVLEYYDQDDLMSLLDTLETVSLLEKKGGVHL